jgi:NADH dehydrogenase (ubiquinone) Fe-S protein 1
VGALDAGYKAGVSSIRKQKPKILYLLGADEDKVTQADLNKSEAFVVYQGHHGDRGAELADVVLPGSAYTEKEGTYVNTEGRAQEAHYVVAPPGKAREDWQILRALSEVLGSPLPYDSHKQIRARLNDVSPTLVPSGHLERAGFFKESLSQVCKKKKNYFQTTF